MDGRTIELQPTARRLVQTLVLLLVALKVATLAMSGVFMDEAYYFMWGQHPALSYYDHPPLDAWTLGLSAAVFGWNTFALRLPVALSFVADVFALYLFARQLAAERWRDTFWVTLLLFVATPFYWLMTSAALPDHLLLTFCLYSLYFFTRFFGAREAGGAGSSRDLYLAAVCLGFAGLAKYNAAFLGLAVLIYVLLRDRRALVEGRLYLAAAIALLMQLPVIIWNVTDGYASWLFILQNRHAGLRTSFAGLLSFGLALLVVISPILFWPIGRFLFVRRDPLPAVGLARIAFVLSSLSIVAIATTTATLFHWNLVAYAAMLPFLAFYLRPRWLLGLQATYGTAFAVAVFVNYAITPLTPINAWRDVATAWSYGWGPTATAVAAARDANKAGFIATSAYSTASLLGFAMHDRDVVSLAARTDEYDYWFDPKAHAGEDAILLGDTWQPLRAEIAAQFTSVTELEALPVEKNGVQIDLHHIYLARGFKPAN